MKIEVNGVELTRCVQIGTRERFITRLQEIKTAAAHYMESQR